MELCRMCGDEAVVKKVVDGKDTKTCLECGFAVPYSCDDDSNVDEGDESDQEGETNVCRSCGDCIDVKYADRDSDVTTDTCPQCVQARKENVEAVVEEDDQKKNVEEDDRVKAGAEEKPDRICTSCGGKRFAFVDQGCEKVLVCYDCGTSKKWNDIVHQISPIKKLSHQASWAGHSQRGGKYFDSQNTMKQKTEIYRHCVEYIDILCKKFKMSSLIVEETKIMFDKAYHTEEFYLGSRENKEHMAAVCVYVCARQNDIGLTLLSFKRHVDDYSRFLKARKRLAKCLNIDLQAINVTLTSEIHQCLEGTGIDPCIVPKVINIVSLFRKSYLTIGRSPPGIIAAGIYYAYNTSDQCTKKINLKKWRKQFKRLPNIPDEVFKACNDLFVRLAQELPFTERSEINSRCFHQYIDSVLKFQDNLLHLAYEADFNPVKCIPEEKKKREPEDELLPPCMKKKKTVNRNPYIAALVPDDVDLNAEELKETEFEDEIDSYILSQEESHDKERIFEEMHAV